MKYYLFYVVFFETQTLLFQSFLPQYNKQAYTLLTQRLQNARF